jgi:hypothetical protein
VSVEPSLRAELTGWNAGVRAARESYERTPTVTHRDAMDTGPADTVPRPQYMEVVRANGRLARELREARAELEEARRTIAIAKMRGKPPR